MNPTDVAIQYLNRLNELAPDALADVLNNRVPVLDTSALDDADDCHVVLGCMDDHTVTLGALGIINGLLLSIGGTRVAALYREDGKIERFGLRADLRKES